MDLNHFAKEVHANAVRHGWWDEERSFPEIVALCHSELSEALEEYRNGKPMVYRDLPDTKKIDGVAVELADCIIRILDFCGKYEIDIDSILMEKHKYNLTRPYKHGGKVC